VLYGIMYCILHSYCVQRYVYVLVGQCVLCVCVFSEQTVMHYLACMSDCRMTYKNYAL